MAVPVCLKFYEYEKKKLLKKSHTFESIYLILITQFLNFFKCVFLGVCNVRQKTNTKYHKIGHFPSNYYISLNTLVTSV